MSPKLEIPAWTGGHRLTAGAFSEYACRVVEVFRACGYDSLALGGLKARLEAASARLAEFATRERAYDETPAVARADATRDAFCKAFYYAWHYLAQIDSSNPLYEAVMTLRSEMAQCKGVWEHELARETSELKSLQRELARPQNAAALQALGLSAVVQALFAANDAVEAALADRDAARGRRIAGRGGDTTAALRREMANLLLESYRQVNAAARINPGEATERAIKDVNGIIAHYRDIAAQPAKRRRSGVPKTESAAEASAP